MIGIFKRLAMAPRGLRYKLLVSFSLMSIIPLLVSAYLVSVYIFPALDNIYDISVVVLLATAVAMLGFALAKRLVDPVIRMALEAKMIANGEYDRKIPVTRDDEIGYLGDSINIMTQKIKNNLDELKDYGQRTREINIEIHKKILALSSLLQIGDMLAASSMDLKGVLDMAVQKVAVMFEEGFAVLYLVSNHGGDFEARASHNADDEKLIGLSIRPGSGFLGRILEDKLGILIDSSVKASGDMEKFKKLYDVNNMVALPLYSGRNNLGVLIVGNRQDGFKYKNEDVDLIKVFAKQMTIAIENDTLTKKAEELAIVDDLTGLYNKSYISTRLEEEIKRAIFYQKPCSFILFNIDSFDQFRQAHGELAGEEVLRKVAKVIRDNITPLGKVARTGGNEFAMLLPDKNKREATEIAEDVRKKIEGASLSMEGKAKLSVSGGVSENPIDGATSDELFKKASHAVGQAKAMGKNKVVA